MKILHLNYEYPPLGSGGASVCCNIAEKQAASGHEVTVITMIKRGLSAQEVVKGVNIIRVKCLRSREKVCHPWEQLTYCLSALFYIHNKLELNQYNVIHCHFIVPTGLLALWLKKIYKISYILTAQGSDVLGHNNKRFKILYRLIKKVWISIIKNAKYLTVPSKFLMDEVHETIPQQECKIIPNGIDPGKYCAGEKKKIIVTLCRLQESKGIQDLIEALANIDIGDWQVYIIGTGPYRNELEKLISEYELKKVYLTGYLSDEEVKKFLSDAGVYFTGSRFEAMPVSVLEAMASGCNIIASNIPPHRQLLKEINLYTSIPDLEGKILSCCRVQPERIKYDIDRYSWDNIVGKYMDLYR